MFCSWVSSQSELGQSTVLSSGKVTRQSSWLLLPFGEGEYKGQQNPAHEHPESNTDSHNHQDTWGEDRPVTTLYYAMLPGKNLEIAGWQDIITVSTILISGGQASWLLSANSRSHAIFTLVLLTATGLGSLPAIWFSGCQQISIKHCRMCELASTREQMEDKLEIWLYNL